MVVLGPGNLNDIDLGALLDRYRRIHLVDLDVASVRAGVRRHRVAEHPGVVVHEPTDLSGVLEQLGRPADSALARCVERDLQRSIVVHQAPFDVCVSTCVLTQMLQSVIDSSLPRAEAVRISIALRDKHLRDLITLTRPGGSIVLITDVVSTSTAPSLLGLPPADLEPEMARLVAAGNFFTATNPYRIVALFQEHPDLREQVTNVRLVDPWLWSVTRDRQHLVCAVTVDRR